MAERLVGNARNTVVRRRTEREREELRALSRRTVEAQENERRTIAHELHNVLGQSMTVLKLILDKAMHSSAEGIWTILEEAQAVVDEVVARVRDLSLELLPSMLDDLGLLPTLLWYCPHHNDRTGVRVNFKHTGLNRNFPPEVSTAAYRIVQEALTNATHHAQVGEVTVHAWADGKMLSLHIEDLGIGFEPAKVPVGAYSGIKGMQERALSLGGKLTIESTPGAGTTVAAELPLSRSKRDGR